jgi:type II restriction enzyme
MADYVEAMEALDSVISKGRSHMYKPIQIAEILYHARTVGIDFSDTENYRLSSLQWRDDVSQLLVGATSGSTSRYQDDLFGKGAPPDVLQTLSQINIDTDGGVEQHIYTRLATTWAELKQAREYIRRTEPDQFSPQTFMDQFIGQASKLSKSTDKALECLTYGFVKQVIASAHLTYTLSLDTTRELAPEVAEFTQRAFGLSKDNPEKSGPIRVSRVGVTNAADAGIDIQTNVGLSLQVKHDRITPSTLSKMLEKAVYDRVVIVCKEYSDAVAEAVADEDHPVQSIITLSEIDSWYRSLRIDNPLIVGAIVDLTTVEFEKEFPHVTTMKGFAADRGYDLTQVLDY